MSGRLTLDNNKEQLRRYLLGTLIAHDREALDERLLFSEELHLELMVIEQELIDEYVAGELSPSDRKGFEAHFLEDAFRKEQLRFGESFNSYLRNPAVSDLHQPVTNPLLVASSPLVVSKTNSFARQAAMVAVLFVALGGVLAAAYWRMSHRPPVNHTGRLVVSLDSGMLRTDLPRQKVSSPKLNSEVLLELKVATAKYKSYRVELFKEKQSVDLREGLTAETQGTHAVVPVVVESEVLEPGDYEVKLSGSIEPSQEETVGTYTFRVCLP